MNTEILLSALTSLALSITGCRTGKVGLAVAGQLGGVLVLFAILLKFKMQ